MDDTDLQILSHLRRNGRLTMVELGKLVGLSSPSAAERVRKLEDRGVITGYSANICYEKLNKHVTAFILMEPKSCKHYAAFLCGAPGCGRKPPHYRDVQLCDKSGDRISTYA